MPADVAEIRRILQVWDASASASGRAAVGMLEGITKAVAADPDTFNLLDEPDEAEAWEAAGGSSYCENEEFPNLLAKRWLEVLSQPDFSNAGYDKDELKQLGVSLQGWAAAIGKVGLEFGDEDLLWAKVAELIEAAPDASDDDSD